MEINVIIPCYNIQNYIGRCLDSLLSQTIGFENLEIILVNDASTDDTLDYLKQFEKEHSDNVIVVNCDENSGAASARNIGMQYATCRYVTFVDADDCIAPDMLLLLKEKIESCDADMAECDYSLFKTDSERILVNDEGYICYDLTDTAQRKDYIIRHGVRSAVWGRLYNRRFLESVGASFIPDMYFEDVVYSGKLMLEYRKVVCLNAKLYFYFDNTNGLISSVNYEKARGAVKAVRELITEILAEQKLTEIFRECFAEIEYYCILKNYLDPLRQVINLKSDDRSKEIMFYKDSLIEMFSNAERNVYLSEIAGKNELVALLVKMLNMHSKVTVKIIGGLGNQMFCYSYGKMLADYLGASLCLDITDYYYGYFRRYLLDYFTINDCSRIWYRLDNPTYAENINLPVGLLESYDLIFNVDEIDSTEKLFNEVKGHKNIYVYGYGGVHFLDRKNVEKLQDDFKPVLKNFFYEDFLNEIADKNSVSVHIRRTDFLTLGWNDNSENFYNAAMNYFRKSLEKPYFYIFSDDNEWTKSKFGKFNDCICIDSMGGETQSLYDMLAMAACRYHIITRKSTFGKWASMLCNYPNSITVCEKEDDIAQGEFRNINMIFLDKEEIKKLSIIQNEGSEKIEKDSDREADFNKTQFNVISNNTEVSLKTIENFILDNKNEEALSEISRYAFSRQYYEKKEYHDLMVKLCEYKSVAYTQFGTPELAADALDAYRLNGGIINYDFLYNSAVNELMNGRKLHAICYGATAKSLYEESDIEELLNLDNPKTEYENISDNNDELNVCLRSEKEIYDCFYKAEAVVREKVKLIMLTAYCPSSINKYFISIGQLLKKLGYSVYIWTLGTDDSEILKKEIASNSILISDFSETCIKSGILPEIFLKPSSESDIDRFYFGQYGEKELHRIAENTMGYIVPDCHEFNGINETKERIINWDNNVNDDDVVYGTVSLLEAIMYKIDFMSV